MQAALLCLYFYGAPQQQLGANAVALMLASALVFVKIPFSTIIMDQAHFVSSLVLVFWTAGAFFVRHNYCFGTHTSSFAKNKNNSDACIFALAALTDSIYRTPENPYVSIFVLILTIRQWLKVFNVMAIMTDDHDYHSYSYYYTAIDLILTTWYICLTIEVGLLPQFTHREDWPIYGGAAVYAAFAVACFYHSSDIKI